MRSPLIHEAVERQAQLRPDGTAIVHRDERVSYRTLTAAAEQYAAELARRGVGPGQIVPVLLPRSARLVAVLLAVLRRGAAYAALDPDWPAPRVSAILAQLRASLLVTDPGVAGGPVQAWRPPPEPLAAVARRGDRARPPATDPATAACIFFTSGTTGVPKAVVSPHRATTRLFTPGGPLEFGPGTVMPQAASIPWDAFSLELWGMLLTGGTAVLVDERALLPDTLGELVRGEGVNTVWLTAALFNLFVEADLASFAGTRRVFIGGERLSPAHVREFLLRHPDIALVNGYGPVESCVFATTHPISLADCDAPTGIPLGRPVPGTEVHVLDDGRACPPGRRGEICIGGDGLAIGYLDDRAQTAARFVELEVGGARRRLYRSGDLGHLDGDGVLHFHGRADRQVKIHGHRVEPAEVEHAARRIPGVGQCAAVPVPDSSGAPVRLALFYTVAAGETAPAPGATDQDPLAVRRLLAERLPSHLVPHAAQRVDAIPVTAYGKVDTRRLLRMLTG
jgi:D-alanine--poly(phosphoribitol) ligase subunit 1